MVEIQTSVRRGMVALPSPKLVKVSTPYMKSGLLYDDHKNYFGTDSPDVLVWTAPSAFMNPLITADRLAREARVTDPLRYRREYEAEFAEDIATFLSAAWIESAVQTGTHEIPPSDGVKYVFAVDTSGGGNDAFTVAGVSAEGTKAERRIVQHVMRGWEKPRGSQVSLEGAVEEISRLVKSYGYSRVYGDRYAPGTVSSSLIRSCARPRTCILSLTRTRRTSRKCISTVR